MENMIPKHLPQHIFLSDPEFSTGCVSDRLGSKSAWSPKTDHQEETKKQEVCVAAFDERDSKYREIIATL